MNEFFDEMVAAFEAEYGGHVVRRKRLEPEDFITEMTFTTELLKDMASCRIKIQHMAATAKWFPDKFRRPMGTPRIWMVIDGDLVRIVVSRRVSEAEKK